MYFFYVYNSSVLIVNRLIDYFLILVFLVSKVFIGDDDDGLLNIYDYNDSFIDDDVDFNFSIVDFEGEDFDYVSEDF